jgi:hypothetical protein
MINASAYGWIAKFFAGQNFEHVPFIDSPALFYKKTRATGFIYGHAVVIDSVQPLEISGWTFEEISKVSLLSTLYDIYRLVTHCSDSDIFINKAVHFYKEMIPQGFNLLKKVLPNNAVSFDLENILHERVQTNENIISKNFSHIITNALLFQDVLAFRQYLVHGSLPKNYLKKLEETIVSIVSLGLQAKTKKSDYDVLLIKLFEASVRYTKFSHISNQNIEALHLEYFEAELEKYYLLDMAVLSLWEDEKVEESERFFLSGLSKILSISDDFTKESIQETNTFILKYRNQIPYFNYSNAVKHFYDHMVEKVALLIFRNKKRLVKELSNNKELVLLLTHSTHRQLKDKEKKKVKKQLLEVCKTIPSLTIFLLPGGTLLLPILIKFIPQMLPSAFNENFDND